MERITLREYIMNHFDQKIQFYFTIPGRNDHQRLEKLDIYFFISVGWVIIQSQLVSCI